MLLRHVVNHFARQYAEQHVRRAMARAVEGEPAADGAADPGDFQIAFVFAVEIESGGLIDRVAPSATFRYPEFVHRLGKLESGQSVAVVESGTGPQRAEAATRALLELHRPRWIVSAGLATALTDDLRRGNVVMPDEVVEPSGERLEIGLNVSDPASSGVRVGRLLTVPDLIRDPDQRRSLGEQHGAIAVDMETMGVARACADQGARFLAVRVISERVDDRVPPEIEQLVRQKTLAGKLGAATGALVRRPSSAKEMWKLREDALKAADKLAGFLLAIAPRLLEEDA